MNSVTHGRNNTHTDLEVFLECELLHHYEIQAMHQNVPCFDQIINEMGHFIIFTIFKEVSSENEEMDLQKLEKALEVFTNTLSHNNSYEEVYRKLRKISERYFIKKHYFFEYDWVFSGNPIDYQKGFMNKPLTDVW